MCDRSAEDAYSSYAPDLTFAFVGRSVLPYTRFLFAFWIMITLYIVNFAILYKRFMRYFIVHYLSHFIQEM
jgi:hypothetical protein